MKWHDKKHANNQHCNRIQSPDLPHFWNYLAPRNCFAEVMVVLHIFTHASKTTCWSYSYFIASCFYRKSALREGFEQQIYANLQNESGGKWESEIRFWTSRWRKQICGRGESVLSSFCLFRGPSMRPPARWHSMFHCHLCRFPTNISPHLCKREGNSSGITQEYPKSPSCGHWLFCVSPVSESAIITLLAIYRLPCRFLSPSHLWMRSKLTGRFSDSPQRPPPRVSLASPEPRAPNFRDS